MTQPSRPNPLRTAWVLGVAVAAGFALASQLLGSGCSSAMPQVPALSPVQMCRVMATQPPVMVTEPDLVNLGDLKALVARLKACNVQPGAGL